MNIKHRLQFFVHNDPDAVRIELAGSLSGKDAEIVYRAWKRAALPDVLKLVIVDITFVTDADEYGRALLVVMHRYGARINAQSPESSAIAQPIVSEPTEIHNSKSGWLRMLLQFLRDDPSESAAIPAHADVLTLASAHGRDQSVQYTDFGDLPVPEDAVH